MINRVSDWDGGYILVQGSGSLTKPLLEACLVDEIRLLVTPAIVGAGKRLFSENIVAAIGPAQPALRRFPNTLNDSFLRKIR